MHLSGTFQTEKQGHKDPALGTRTNLLFGEGFGKRLSVGVLQECRGKADFLLLMLLLWIGGGLFGGGMC